MVFPQVDMLPRHPSPLYQAAGEGLLLFILLWWYSARQRPRGAVSGVFLIGYGMFRFLAEFFREPDHGIFGQSYIVSMGQWLSLPMIADRPLLMLPSSLANQVLQRFRHMQGIALRVVDAQAAHGGEHRFVDDEFGDGMQLLVLRQPHHGLDHRAVVQIVVGIADEHAVDLQGLHLEPLQVGETRQPAAEIVQRQVAADLAAEGDEGQRQVELGDGAALGDLEADPPRLDAPFAEDLCGCSP